MSYEYDESNSGGKRSRTVIKKKGGWLGKIVALLLGFVLGVVGGIGGLIGAGYYIVTQVKLQDGVNTVNNLAGLDINLTDYVGKDYTDGTVVDLVDGAWQALVKIGEGKGTLNDLNAISPMVKTLLDGDTGKALFDTLESYGISLTADELMDKYLSKSTSEELDERYLIDFLITKIDDIPVGDLLRSLGVETNRLITALCYGTEGEDYKIENGKYVMINGATALTITGLMGDELEERFNNLSIDTLLGAPKDDIMRAIFYGPSHRYKVVGDKVTMTQVRYTHNGTTFLDDTGEQLLLQSAVKIGNSSDYLLTFADGTEQIVEYNATEDVYYAYTNEKVPRKVMYKKVKLGDLTKEAEELINCITLESALGVTSSSHALIKEIAYDGETKRTIGDLRNHGKEILNGIRLSQLIEEDTESSVIMYLLYGKEDVHYSIIGGEVTPLLKRVAIWDGKLYDEYGMVMENATLNTNGTYTQGGVTYRLIAIEETDETSHETKQATLTVRIPREGKTSLQEQAPAYYVEHNSELLYFEPTTFGTLQDGELLANITARLTLSDFMDVSDNKLLKHLGDQVIDELPAAINELSVDDVFGEHFLYRGRNSTTGKVNFYCADENHKPTDEHGVLQPNVYFIDIKNNSVDYDNDGVISRDELDKALTGTWKYLLLDRTTDTVSHTFTVTEMDQLIDRMSANVHDATIRELKLDGIVKNLEDETLNTVIIGEIPAPTISDPLAKKEIKIKQGETEVRIDLLDGDATDIDHVSDLTVEQLMLYVAALLEAIS